MSASRFPNALPLPTERAYGAAAGRVVELLARASLVLGVAYGIYYLAPGRFISYLRQPRSTDFALYYRDARIGIEYGWSHMYDIMYQVRTTQQVMPITRDAPDAGSLSIPLLTWLAAPFAMLPLPVGFVLWEVLIAACLAGTFWLVAPIRGRRSLALHLVLWLFFAPLGFAFALGQSTALVALSVAAAARLLRSGREWSAGAVLGIALIKPQLVILVPLCLLVGGHWRAGLALAAFVLAMIAATLVTVSLAGVAELVTRIVHASQSPSTWLVIPYAAPIAYLAGLPKLLAAAAVALVTAASAWRQRMSSDRMIAAGIIGSLLAAPYLHLQDLLLLAVAGSLLLAAGAGQWERRYLAIGYLQAALAISLLPLMEAGWLLATLTMRKAPMPST